VDVNNDDDDDDDDDEVFKFVCPLMCRYRTMEFSYNTQHK